jgi:hypothetical protein
VAVTGRRVRLLPNATVSGVDAAALRGGPRAATSTIPTITSPNESDAATPPVLVTGQTPAAQQHPSQQVIASPPALSPLAAASPLAGSTAPSTTQGQGAAPGFEMPTPELLAFTNAVDLTPKQRDRLVDVFIGASSAERKVIAAMYKQAFRDPGFVQKLTLRIQTVFASVIASNSSTSTAAAASAAAPAAGARRARDDESSSADGGNKTVVAVPSAQPSAATRLRELRQQLDVSMCRVPNAGPYRVAFRVVKSVAENDHAIALYSTQFVHPTATAMKDIVQLPRTASTRSRATRTGNFTWYIECEVDPALRSSTPGAGGNSALPSSAAAAAALASPPPVTSSIGDAAVGAALGTTATAAPQAKSDVTTSGAGREPSPLSAATSTAAAVAIAEGGAPPSHSPHPFYPSATLAAAAPPPLPAAEMACLATVIVHPFNGGDVGSTCFIEVPLFATAAGYKRQGLARLLNAALQDHAVYLRAACIVVSADVGAVPFWTGKSMGGYGPLSTDLRRRIEYTYQTEGTPFDGAKLLCWVPPRNPAGTFCTQRTQAALDALPKFVLEGPARLPSP